MVKVRGISIFLSAVWKNFYKTKCKGDGIEIVLIKLESTHEVEKFA